MADPPSPHKRLTSIVVGAGAAGLAAARQLHDTGCQVTVLEARDRLGGRVWAAFDLAPYPIELGAEYIHGAPDEWRLVNHWPCTRGLRKIILDLSRPV